MNQSFRKGFEKTANKKKEEFSAGDVATITGVGTGAAVAGREIITNALLDTFEKKKIKSSRSTKDFLKKLKPGDVILTGAQKGSSLDTPIVLKDYFETFEKNKNKLIKRLGAKKLPINEHDLLKLVSGSPFYHMAIYTGKGNVVNADGNLVRGEKLRNMIEGGTAKAYRFKGAPKKETTRAVSRASKLKGREYMTIPEQIRRGAQMLVDPTKGGRACRRLPNGRVVCTDVVQAAYPERLRRKIIDASDVRKAKDSQLIARYGKRKLPFRQKAIAKFISPIAKSTRFALPAAALGGLGALAYDAYKGKKKEGPKKPPSLKKPKAPKAPKAPKTSQLKKDKK